jgi:deoxyribose-phosphate aldolase
MSNEMIQKITEEVMRKLDQDNLSSARQTNQNLQTSNKKINYKISSGNSALILLCGGNREIEEVMRQIEIISKTYTNTYIVMTRAAIKIIGMPDVRKVSEGATIITEYSEEYFDNILGRIDVIYVPILSLNTAAKVAALNADSLGTITMVFGLMYGKPVIAAQDSIYCCQIEKDQVPPAMNRKIDGVIDQLTSMGIRMVNVHNLSDQEPSPYTPTTSSRSYTIGTAGKDIGVDGKSQVAVKALVNGGATRITSETGINGYDIDLAQHIDHTNLRADATDEEIKKLCEEAAMYKFASVCINPTNVSKAAKYLKGSSVKVCTVIGFPLGATTPTVKAIETRDAIANGAEEVDMVINVGALKSGNDDLVRQDIQAVVNAAAGKAIVKVILETALLTKEQIVKGSLLTKLSGADFVKTSTGFSTAGALVEDIALMRKTVGPEMGVKAAGGIRTHEIAEQMINAGATRIGASASIAIVKGTDSKTGTY